MKINSRKKRLLEFFFFGIPKNGWHLIGLICLNLITYAVAPLMALITTLVSFVDIYLTKQIREHYEEKDATSLIKLAFGKFAAFGGVLMLIFPNIKHLPNLHEKLIATIDIWYIYVELCGVGLILAIAIPILAIKWLIALKQRNVKLKPMKKFKNFVKNLKKPLEV